MGYKLHYNPSTGTISYWPKLGVSSFTGVVDAGGLDITWPVSKLYTQPNTGRIDMDAGSDTCTDDTTNYLLWSSGAGLALGTTAPTDTEVLVSTITTSGGDITDVTDADVISRTLHISHSAPLVPSHLWQISNVSPPKFVWQSGTGYARDMAVDNDENIFVAGYKPSPTASAYKYNRSGSELWHRQYVYTSGASVCVDPTTQHPFFGEERWIRKRDKDTGAVLAHSGLGEYYMAYGIVSDGTQVVATGNYSAIPASIVRAFNANLSVINWTYAPAMDSALAIAVDSVGDLIIVGGKGGDTCNIVKLNSGGVFQWSYDYNTDCRSVCVDGSDNIYIGSDSAVGQRVLKLNSAGDYQDEYVFGDVADCITTGVFVDSGGYIYTCGNMGRSSPKYANIFKANSSGVEITSSAIYNQNYPSLELSQIWANDDYINVTHGYGTANKMV